MLYPLFNFKLTILLFVDGKIIPEKFSFSVFISTKEPGFNEDGDMFIVVKE